MPPSALLDARAIALRLEKLAHADTNQFAALARLTGLDPARDFQHLNLSYIDVRGEDLTPFNLSRALFIGTRIAGTKFGPSVRPEQLAQANWSTGGVVIALGRMAARAAQRVLQNTRGTALVVRRFDDSRSLYIVTQSNGANRTVRSLAEAVGDAEHVVLIFGEQEQPLINLEEFSAVLSKGRLVVGLQIEAGHMGLAPEYAAALAALCSCKATVPGFNQIDDKGLAAIEDGLTTWFKIVDSIPGTDRATGLARGLLRGGEATLFSTREVSAEPEAQSAFAAISRWAKPGGHGLLNFVPTRERYFDENTLRATLDAAGVQAELAQAGPPAEFGALWGVWIAPPGPKAKPDWRIRPFFTKTPPAPPRDKRVNEPSIRRQSLMELAIAKLDELPSDVLVKLSRLVALQRENRATGLPFRKALVMAREIGVPTQALAAAADTSSDRIAKWREGSILPKVKVRLSVMLAVMRLVEAEQTTQKVRNDP